MESVSARVTELEVTEDYKKASVKVKQATEQMQRSEANLNNVS